MPGSDPSKTTKEILSGEPKDRFWRVVWERISTVALVVIVLAMIIHDNGSGYPEIPQFPLQSLRYDLFGIKVEQGGTIKGQVKYHKIRDDCINGTYERRILSDQGQVIDIDKGATLNTTIGERPVTFDLTLPERIQPGLWALVTRIEYTCPNNDGIMIKIDRSYESARFEVTPKQNRRG